MKVNHVLLISLLIVGLLFVPAVSAAEYNFELDDSGYFEQTSLPTGDYTTFITKPDLNYLWILNAQEIYGNELIAVYGNIRSYEIENYNDLPQSAATSVTIGDFMTGVFGYYKYQSESKNYLECYLIQIEYINDYPTGLTGKQKFLMVPDDPNFIFPSLTGEVCMDLTGDYNLKFAFGRDINAYPFPREFKYDSIFKQTWKQNLIINTNDYHDSIKLIRNGLPSIIYIETPNLGYTNNPSDNSDYLVYLDALNDRPYLISVKNPITNKYFNYTVNLDGQIGDPGEPGGVPVDIYVKSSQTGALLADARVIIKDTTTDPWSEVANQTLPSGQGTFSLAKDPGFNPTQYHINATVPGYQQLVPSLFFRVVGSMNVVVEMEPIEGGPADENNTFLEFYVRNLEDNPVSNAMVSVDGQIRWTNSQGWIQFEVPKNASYSYTVSKSGYSSLTGNAVIGSDARYTINAVISPAVTPTLPTPIPTKTPVKPSPTLTSPTGEPVSNLLEWFAAHFGMLLGGGVEIGKIFMWLCFTIPAGVYVGKQAKAGAAGFMAGAGIVTLFFVVIGWVPVWLVVIIALVIGLLYAKVFSNIGNGGGR